MKRKGNKTRERKERKEESKTKQKKKRRRWKQRNDTVKIKNVVDRREPITVAGGWARLKQAGNGWKTLRDHGKLIEA